MTAESSNAFDPATLRRDIRTALIFMLASGAGLLLAEIVLPLPHFVRFLIGGFSGFFLFVTGARLFFCVATLVSVNLTGPSRVRFQVAVSLFVPLIFALLLSTRVDAMPLETLGHILTWWLVIPLGILGLIGWQGSTMLNRAHPFRGFLIVATVLFILCLMWTMGMGSSADDLGDDGGGFALDPERAQRAKATGEFVYKYILYMFATYGALLGGFLWRGSKSAQQKAVQDAYKALTPETADHIVSTMGSYIAIRHARPGREADLPFPRAAIEIAFSKAIRESADPTRRSLLTAVYVDLDDYTLTDDDCAALTAYDSLIAQGAAKQTERGPEEFKALAEKLLRPEMQRAVEIRKRLAEASRRRHEMAKQLIAAGGSGSRREELGT